MIWMGKKQSLTLKFSFSTLSPLHNVNFLLPLAGRWEMPSPNRVESFLTSTACANIGREGKEPKAKGKEQPTS